MKKVQIALFSLLLVLSLSVWAQDSSPLAIVQKQLDTYNAQDIDGFAAVFAEDVEIFSNIGDSVPSMKGREELHARYGKMFKENPQNKSTLKGRMVQGNFVFDHEWITGRDKEFSIVAIYEVQDGFIQRAWFVR